MYVTVFFTAVCGCHCPEALTQRQWVQPPGYQLGLPGSANCESFLVASGTISAREAVSVNPQRSIFLPYRKFPYLGLQCSSPALSSHPACHKEDRLFYLSFLPVHPIQLLRPHRTKYQLIKIHSGALEQEKSGMECAFSLPSPMLHSGYSHAAFRILPFLCKLKTQGDQVLEPRDKACAHSIFYNSHTTKYFVRLLEFDIKGIIWSIPVSVSAKGDRMKHPSLCSGTGKTQAGPNGAQVYLEPSGN